MRLPKICKKEPRVVAALVCLFAAALGGFMLGYVVRPPKIVTAQAVREKTTEYKFIHPLLFVARPDIATPSAQYAALAKSVTKYISSQISFGVITNASVYFIDYGKNGSFALNETEPYAPASLLKVVIMVAYLKKSESDPSLLKKEFTYYPSLAQSIESIPFETPSVLMVGRSYSVEDLINKMIIDSDNGAMNALLANIDNAYLDKVYDELGLQGPSNTGAPYTISAKDYSVFFRVLYNGSYLANTTSEKALSILSNAAFRDGLAAGVPAGTVVAHKFGEHVNGEDGQIDSVELHDCGIVYLENGGPYLLCVMTKGPKLDSLEQTIGTISKMVYGGVTAK